MDDNDLVTLGKLQESQLITKFYNCRILRNHKLVDDELYVRNGKVVDAVELFFKEKRVAHIFIDCKGGIIAPGLIDLQINGGFGYDFSYYAHTDNAIKVVSKQLLQYGVVAYCPTVVTSPSYVYHDILDKIKRTKGGKNGAAILGVHVEGPFINKEKKGAHPEKFMMDHKGSMVTIKETYGEGYKNISIITLAPEMKSSDSIIKKLKADGKIVSLGHSMANLLQGENAVKCGATLITHLFNAMLPFHHRDPGLVGLLTSDQIQSKNLFFGIISDGIHTHPSALRIAYKVHPEGLVLVTDALSALGLNDGRHRIGQMEFEIRGGMAFVSGTNTLCGSVASMLECVRFFINATGCPWEYALEAGSLHPAKVLGIDKHKGHLNPGADADFIILDNHLQLKSTWIAGEKVYEALRL
ncbi:N-acetylglucosamine-6-phosphate deacetylase [Diorhabda carinulata]|uniref:N-acetylglucosamine-6-phosphate deacetylase n=1 Tax=Diorhabda sublineata TaxID=1163346 RepID=UPI0024E0F74A|nr:N-acetylglucosamine-6-phosphate deacetylase [Diorhabda sublineata]XP_057651975.1 N-acetylglucosamine-6-phosphate deacetylase [Diorhabda carinulata]